MSDVAALSVGVVAPPPEPMLTVCLDPGRPLLIVHADGRVEAPDVESASEAGRVFVESVREQLGRVVAAAVDERAADLGATAWSQYAVVRPNDGAALGPMPLGQAVSLAEEIGGRVMVRRIIHGVWVSHG